MLKPQVPDFLAVFGLLFFPQVSVGKSEGRSPWCHFTISGLAVPRISVTSNHDCMVQVSVLSTESPNLAFRSQTGGLFFQRLEEGKAETLENQRTGDLV